VISEKVGLKLENADISLLGEACKVVACQGEVGVGPTATKESPWGTPGAAERPRHRM
jgi:hypothetical protein